ncbi:MAG: hypothetical protein V8Q27_01770 [Eubacteriales bacterium]
MNSPGKKSSAVLALPMVPIFCLISPVNGIDYINGNVFVMMADIVHHPGNGIHGVATGIVARGRWFRGNFEWHPGSIPVESLSIIPVEHFLNRIIKGMNPLIHAIGAKLSVGSR